MPKRRPPLRLPQRSNSAAIEGKVLHHNVALQGRYKAGILMLTRAMHADVKAALMDVMKSATGSKYFAQDASLADMLASTMQRLFNHWESVFDTRAPVLANNMVNGAGQASATALTNSMADIAKGSGVSLGIPDLQQGKLADIYTASVNENVKLIESIPEQYLADVNGAVMRSVTTGNGLQDLVPALSKLNGENERRATNIALDQTRKVYNNVNKQRMQDLGMTSYGWIHSGGGKHPRPLHVGYNGRTFRFDDPPIIDERTGERGIPGQAINCGCTMKPMFVFEDDDDDDE